MEQKLSRDVLILHYSEEFINKWITLNEKSVCCIQQDEYGHFLTGKTVVIRSKYFVGYEFKKRLLEVQQAIIVFTMIN